MIHAEAQPILAASIQLHLNHPLAIADLRPALRDTYLTHIQSIELESSDGEFDLSVFPALESLTVRIHRCMRAIDTRKELEDFMAGVYDIEAAKAGRKTHLESRVKWFRKHSEIPRERSRFSVSSTGTLSRRDAHHAANAFIVSLDRYVTRA